MLEAGSVIQYKAEANKETYIVDPLVEFQVNPKYTTRRQIQRVDLGDEKEATQQEKQYHQEKNVKETGAVFRKIVQLNPKFDPNDIDDFHYRLATRKFNAGSGKIIKVEYVNNGKLAQQLDNIRRQDGTKSFKVLGFHGCSQAGLNYIIQKGFDFNTLSSYQGQNLGKGAYLSEYANAAHEYTKGQGVMLVCAALITRTTDPAKPATNPSGHPIMLPLTDQRIQTWKASPTSSNHTWTVVVEDLRRVVPVYAITYQ